MPSEVLEIVYFLVELVITLQVPSVLLSCSPKLQEFIFVKYSVSAKLK